MTNINGLTNPLGTYQQLGNQKAQPDGSSSANEASASSAEAKKKQATAHSIIKYRRPPNIEDIRHKYGMLLTSRHFAWTNFKRYLYLYDFAYSNLPTRGERTYLVRQSLFVGLVVSLFWLLAASF